MDNLNIGDQLKRWREKRGYTQEELARGLFDRSYISQIESGRILPPLRTLELLCQKLDIPLSDLIGAKEDTTGPNVRRARHLLSSGLRQRDVTQIYLAWEILSDAAVGEDVIRAARHVWKLDPEIDRVLYVLQRTALKILHEGYERDDGLELLVNLGNTYYRVNQYLNALSVYQTIIDLKPPTVIRMRVLSNIGSTTYAIGRFEDALDAYHGALEMASEQDNHDMLGRCHHGLGIVYRALGDTQKGYHHTFRSMIYYGEGEPLKYYEALHNLGVLLAERGDYLQAEEFLTQCAQYYERAKAYALLGSVWEEIARLQLGQENLQGALEACNYGLQQIYSTDDTKELSRLLILKGQVLEALGEHDMASVIFPLARYLHRVFGGALSSDEES
jgi:transcriptional regulator with XRE-family HTH domain